MTDFVFNPSHVHRVFNSELNMASIKLRSHPIIAQQLDWSVSLVGLTDPQIHYDMTLYGKSYQF